MEPLSGEMTGREREFRLLSERLLACEDIVENQRKDLSRTEEHLRLSILDCCEMEESIRKLVLPILGADYIDGDTFDKPGTEDLVEQVVKETIRFRMALEQIARTPLHGGHSKFASDALAETSILFRAQNEWRKEHEAAKTVR